MPFYDLRCSDCEKEFNIMATVSEKSEKRVPCPECGSFELETIYKSAPYYLKGGSSKSAECPNSHVCGAGCPHSKAG